MQSHITFSPHNAYTRYGKHKNTFKRKDLHVVNKIGSRLPAGRELSLACFYFSLNTVIIVVVNVTLFLGPRQLIIPNYSNCLYVFYVFFYTGSIKKFSKL